MRDFLMVIIMLLMIIITVGIADVGVVTEKNQQKQYTLDSLKFEDHKRQTLMIDSLLNYTKSIYLDVRTVK